MTKEEKAVIVDALIREYEECLTALYSARRCAENKEKFVEVGYSAANKEKINTNAKYRAEVKQKLLGYVQVKKQPNRTSKRKF